MRLDGLASGTSAARRTPSIKMPSSHYAIFHKDRPCAPWIQWTKATGSRVCVFRVFVMLFDPFMG